MFLFWWAAAGHFYWLTACHYWGRHPEPRRLGDILQGMLLCWALGPILYAVKAILQRSSFA